MIHLSVIIPAYNEERRIGPTLRAVSTYLEKQPYSFEVLVIDDGSRDATLAIVAKHAASHSHVRAIPNGHNKGKGGVVRQGMQEASGAFRLFMDADGSTPITEVAKLLAHTEEAEVIIGSRRLAAAAPESPKPWQRRLISFGSNWLIRALVLPGIFDTQCGFKLFSANAATLVFAKQTARGWLFDVELLVTAKERGLAIIEVPVEWHDVAGSTLRASRAVSQSLVELFRIRRNLRAGLYR